MALTINIAVDQAANFAARVVVTDWTGEVLDLANVESIVGEVRRTYFSVDPSATFTFDITDATNGEFVLSLSADDTAALKANHRYVYDVVALFDDDTRLRLYEGVLTVNGRATETD